MGVKYFWIEPDKHDEGEQIGLIAQDVEKVFPEAVRTDEQGFKSIAYMSLIAPVINAVKELYNKFLRLEKVLSLKADRLELIKLREISEKQNAQIMQMKIENAILTKKLEQEKLERLKMHKDFETRIKLLEAK